MIVDCVCSMLYIFIKTSPRHLFVYCPSSSNGCCRVFNFLNIFLLQPPTRTRARHSNASHKSIVHQMDYIVNVTRIKSKQVKFFRLTKNYDNKNFHSNYCDSDSSNKLISNNNDCQFRLNLNEAAFGPKINTDNIPGTPMELTDIGSDTTTTEYIQTSQSHNQSQTIISDVNNSSSDKRRYSDRTKTPSDVFIKRESSNINYYGNGHIGGGGGGGGNQPPNNNNTSKDNVSGNISENNSRRISKQDVEGLDPESLMFRDGRRKIDMVICYEEENEGVMTEAEARRIEQRKTFQESLIKEGLELESEHKDQAFDEKTFFVKIHLPWRTETQYAEVMNMKLPVKRFITISVKAWVRIKYKY